ncbi:MAG: Flp family type IVb pilin [Mesorhizobium sp.]|jgi:pilus assembly protein Flp/PilA
MTRLLCRFLRDENAATAIEYGLIAALVSLAIFAGVGHFATNLGALWDGNSGKISEAFNQ